MAPQKKSKKDANSINSKLALVMKSGKGMHERLWNTPNEFITN
jgi:hypothetical protein